MISFAEFLPFAASALTLFVYMTGAFVAALQKKNNSIADIAYGPGFILAAIVTAIMYGGRVMGLLLTLLVIIWGARLAWRIHRRNRGKPEGFRYAAWRTEWTWFNLRSYLQIFMLQGGIIFAMISPVVVANAHFANPSLTLLTLIGLFIWCIGFFFEAAGDAQLDRFIRNPENKGKIMDKGLWGLTRHPNYFGEATMWWGIWIAALPATIPLGIFAVIGTLLASPVLITYLLLKVSGVPMLENAMQGKPGWDEYARRVPVFVPRFRSHSD